MSRRRLLALDLDGTLVQADGSVHPEDRAAIRRAREAGIHVTINTGRLFSGSRGVAEAAGIDGPIACVDGCQIVDRVSGDAMSVTAMAQDALSIVNEATSCGNVARFVFERDRVLCDALGEPFLPYVTTWSRDVEQVDALGDHRCWHGEDQTLAMVGVGDREVIREAAARVRALAAELLFVVDFPVKRFDSLGALLLRAHGPNKGTALRFLAEHYACAMEDVVAVGDWINDEPMFEVAGRSFVMGQAPDHVKDKATDHLEARTDRGDAGIAEAVRRAFGL